MSELNIVIALAIIYAILWMAKHKVFMYQRTIRKIALKYNIPQNRLGFLYPQRYMTLHWVSGMRWVALGVILFLNWKVALGLLVLEAIVTMVYPEQDDFVNMKMMLDDLERNNKGLSNEVLSATRSILGDILDELEPERGWGMIGRELYIKCDDDLIRGEVVNICHAYKEYNKYPYVVIFDKEVSINNSFPHKEHFLYKNEIEDIVNWRLTGSYIHFRF